MNSIQNAKRNVCLVGIGNHMQNKIIPALQKLNIKIEAYVSSKEKKILYLSKHYSTLESAVKILPKKTLFIISSPPSSHFDQIKMISSRGFDIFVEKPAFLSLKEFEVIKNIIKIKNIVFFESLMYLENDIVKKLIKDYSKKKDKIISIKTNFIIPSIPYRSYRNSCNFEDSLFTDMICYPISLLIELGFKIDFNYFSYEIERNKTKKIFKLKFIDNKKELKFSIGEGEYYENKLNIKLKNKNELECYPFFYGREGTRTLVSKNSKKILKKEYFENNCFEKLFQHNRDFWIKNQSSRLKKLRDVTVIIEKLSQIIKEF